MAFTPGTTTVRKNYTGLADMQVFAINPTKAELAEFGITYKDEINYFGEKDGVKSFKVDFWLKHDDPEIKTKVTFFLGSELAATKTGKIRYINDKGMNVAADSLDNLPTNKDGIVWFDKSTARQAYVGECELVDFIRNWLHISPTSEAKLEDFLKIVKGNVTELRNLIAVADGRKIQVLLYVKDGYQQVFTRNFERGGNKNRSRWDKQITEFMSYSGPIAYQNSYALKEFDEMNDAPSTEPVGGANPFADTAPSAEAIEKAKEDIPF